MEMGVTEIMVWTFRRYPPECSRITAVQVDMMFPENYSVNPRTGWDVSQMDVIIMEPQGRLSHRLINDR